MKSKDKEPMQANKTKDNRTRRELPQQQELSINEMSIKGGVGGPQPNPICICMYRKGK